MTLVHSLLCLFELSHVIFSICSHCLFTKARDLSWFLCHICDTLNRKEWNRRTDNIFLLVMVRLMIQSSKISYTLSSLKSLLELFPLWFSLSLDSARPSSSPSPPPTSSFHFYYHFLLDRILTNFTLHAWPILLQASQLMHCSCFIHRLPFPFSTALFLC